MSICSSAASERSCTFQGAEMSVEDALESTVRQTQQCLNNLQQRLRELCSQDEQRVDDFEDMVECVTLEDQTCDLVETITNLLNELPQIAAEIRGPCPPEAKAWWTAHKAERKVHLAAESAKRKEAARATKEATRLAKLAEKSAK
jgi:hypothetical protein